MGLLLSTVALSGMVQSGAATVIPDPKSKDVLGGPTYEGSAGHVALGVSIEKSVPGGGPY